MTEKKPTKTTTPSQKDAEYYFGSVEVVKYEDLNLPQFELSVFASADIADGGFGGVGANDSRRRTILPP